MTSPSSLVSHWVQDVKSTNVCVSCSAHQILNLLVKGSPCVCLCASRERTGGKASLQGNMDPCALYAPKVTSTPTPPPPLTWAETSLFPLFLSSFFSYLTLIHFEKNRKPSEMIKHTLRHSQKKLLTHPQYRNSLCKRRENKHSIRSKKKMI